jgi:hypothetical protein
MHAHDKKQQLRDEKIPNGNKNVIKFQTEIRNAKSNQ